MLPWAPHPAWHLAYLHMNGVCDALCLYVSLVCKAYLHIPNSKQSVLECGQRVQEGISGLCRQPPTATLPAKGRLACWLDPVAQRCSAAQKCRCMTLSSKFARALNKSSPGGGGGPLPPGEGGGGGPLAPPPGGGGGGGGPPLPPGGGGGGCALTPPGGGGGGGGPLVLLGGGGGGGGPLTPPGGGGGGGGGARDSSPIGGGCMSMPVSA